MKGFCKKLSDFLHPGRVNNVEEISQRCNLSIHNGVYKSALEKGSVLYAVDSRSQSETASVAAFMYPSFCLQCKKIPPFRWRKTSTFIIGCFLIHLFSLPFFLT